jgi:addiction module HigA family antidote
MHNPPHPRELLKEDVLPELGLTVAEAARQLGIPRRILSRVLYERAPISAELAVRLDRWLGISADSWLRMQIQYDLWHAEQNSHFNIQPVKRTRAT